ncbi:lipoprotein [Mergibacter septicus]|nr:lipoprotein [Mergibacter septicus]UTU48458.1 lipoprotein [Mergibacter septicus]WMR95913.1 lipoprotein [Mergibacter septicus]
MKKLFVLCLLAISLTACGVKGPLFQPTSDNSLSTIK